MGEEEYEIELYEKLDGSCPVAEFLENLEPKMWAKVARNIDLLALHNITLREPLAKPIEDGIFELRTQVGNNISRVFLFFLHG
jgi:putative component of toxin-antitoxin plasmid stabilization module